MLDDSVPDVLGPEWVARTITLPPDDEGEVVATLVTSADTPQHERAVLYVHGFVDYFFQAEHARHWMERGYDFYALDLRKYGRSLRPHQTPNDVRDLRTYGAEIGAAVRFVRASHPGPGIRVVLLGHSAGGLIGSLWAHGHPGAIDALVLNSPWFDVRGTWFRRVVVARVAEVLGRLAPMVPVGSVDPHYGRALHLATGGAWDYDLTWKPHEGFPARAGWARAVRQGQRQVQKGLDVTVPVLVCASARNGPTNRVSPALADSDCVLDVNHMVRYAPSLGPDVTIVRIEGGVHDLALSAPEVRGAYEDAIFGWLEQQQAIRG